MLLLSTDLTNAEACSSTAMDMSEKALSLSIQIWSSFAMQILHVATDHDGGTCRMSTGNAFQAPALGHQRDLRQCSPYVWGESLERGLALLLSLSEPFQDLHTLPSRYNPSSTWTRRDLVQQPAPVAGRCTLLIWGFLLRLHGGEAGPGRTRPRPERGAHEPGFSRARSERCQLLDPKPKPRYRRR